MPLKHYTSAVDFLTEFIYRTACNRIAEAYRPLYGILPAMSRKKRRVIAERIPHFLAGFRAYEMVAVSRNYDIGSLWNIR